VWVGIVEIHLVDPYVLPPPDYVQKAAQEICENRGILNRVRVSWTRCTEARIASDGWNFEQLL
jgi:ABC-type nitrate/sulfonate/bicarbonate transport system permease component